MFAGKRKFAVPTKPCGTASGSVEERTEPVIEPDRRLMRIVAPDASAVESNRYSLTKFTADVAGVKD
jgi:hypothetical protein